MALTPEDVVNKRFQPTKFREGYDQDEVDDFLDEIVVELRRLNQENDELRRRLSDAPAGTASTGTVPAPVAASTKTEEVREEEKRPEPAKPETRVETVSPAAVPAAVPAAASAESAAGVLAMAQKLHDEYVNAGVEQRDKIIAEAQIEASSLVNDAQDKSRKVLGALEQQKSVLERKVEQLRSFERDYRSRLKAYIEGQLRDLDSRGSVASETADA
ncbi:DivIVA domain-containing protein [uncultured Arthrobacter sp.]|jgi:DivIVA domain-containing protein|uniref:DivIVA domain-containing protein n=1 Tax=uncultured Arthrobacter sp. TaxID=114050 RepID=UPI0025EA77C7|nr:DivIVA domain-containing protein [uncultured Arthrobacter sp.]